MCRGTPNQRAGFRRIDLSMRMRPHRRQLQYADLRLFSADARRDRRHDPQRDEPCADNRLLSHKYGEKVLSAPTAEGFNLLAWTMPFIALVLGGGLMVLLVGRWRSNPPSAPSGSKPAGEPSSFDPELRRRLENELKERR